MKYINEKEKLSIEVFEEYKRVPEEGLDKMGMTKEGKEQTVFMFIINQNGMFDSFNITKDAIYESNEKALSDGVALNIAVLKASGAKLIKEEDLQLNDGSKSKKIIVELNGIKVATIFKSIDGLLLCMGYAYNEDLNTREQGLIQMFSSLNNI